LPRVQFLPAPAAGCLTTLHTTPPAFILSFLACFSCLMGCCLFGFLLPCAPPVLGCCTPYARSQQTPPTPPPQAPHEFPAGLLHLPTSPHHAAVALPHTTPTHPPHRATPCPTSAHLPPYLTHASHLPFCRPPILTNTFAYYLPHRILGRPSTTWTHTYDVILPAFWFTGSPRYRFAFASHTVYHILQPHHRLPYGRRRLALRTGPRDWTDMVQQYCVVYYILLLFPPAHTDNRGAGLCCGLCSRPFLPVVAAARLFTEHV